MYWWNLENVQVFSKKTIILYILKGKMPFKMHKIKNIILCILKIEMPFKMKKKYINSQNNMCAYPT